MKQYMESQREEIRSLSGRGQREVVSAFEKAKLPRRVIPQVDENVESSTASDTLVSEADPSLSISAEDSGIVSIPLMTLTVMCNKAYELLSAENAITPAPGSDTKARMVLSHSQDVPHHIRGGQYL